MMVEVEIGRGDKVSERQLRRWMKLFWKSAEREPFTIKEVILVAVLVLSVINIIVNFVV